MFPLLLLLAADPTPEVIVWSGDAPAGKTWADLGPEGAVTIADNAGLGETKRGLRIRMTARGWRGCGVNWKGWFPPEAATDVSRYAALMFHVRQVTEVADADLIVSLVDNVKRDEGVRASHAVSVRELKIVPRLDGTWRRITIPLERFTRDKPLRLDRLWEVTFANPGGDPVTFEIDRIGFTRDRGVVRFPQGPEFNAAARVRTDRPLHPIRDGIYGVSEWSPDKLKRYAIAMTRWGGNTSSRYNWKLNVDNGAHDWFFKNRGTPISDPAETGYRKALLANKKVGAGLYLTVPMLGWVAKDATSYSYPVSKFGPQQKTEPYFPDVGNGVRPDGTLIRNPDPRSTSIPAPPEFVAEAVRLLAKDGGPAFYALDNEPMLWNSTHRDVFPDPLTYAGLWDRTRRYAEAIKTADPNARVAGFCSWGWTDLFSSAADEGGDSYATRPDSRQHGGVGLAEWFLKRCADHKAATGKRLIDVFDIHWYPQGEVGGQKVYPDGRGEEVARLRLRSTRELWDTTYASESWIARTGKGPPAVLPRVRKWLTAADPEMKLCVGEYNFAGGDDVSGGLAQVEVFGALAREGVDLAFLWGAPEGSQEAAWALFREAGGGFGDRWLEASSDSSDLGVFAARRSRDEAVTVVVVNCNLRGACRLSLDLGDVRGPVRVWRFDAESGNEVKAVEGASKQAMGKREAILPAGSATLFVIGSAKDE